MLRVMRGAVAAALVAMSPTLAAALTFGISSPGVFGLDLGYACLDTAATCSTAQVLSLDATADATGSLTLSAAPTANAMLAASISVSVASLGMSGSGVGPVDGVDMITVDYSGSTTVLVIDAGASWNLVQVAPGSGSVSGAYVQLSGNTPIVSSGFSDATVALGSLSCLVDKTTQAGTCGFDFGASRDFTLGVNLTATDFVHRFNVSVVPEPGGVAGLALGSLGLAWFGRRRAR